MTGNTLSLCGVGNSPMLGIAPSTLECPGCFVEMMIPEGTLSNEILQCADCGMDLEVRNRNGVWSLEPAPEEKEDYGE